MSKATVKSLLTHIENDMQNCVDVSLGDHVALLVLEAVKNKNITLQDLINSLQVSKHVDTSHYPYLM